MENISPEWLRLRIDYDPETGDMVWKTRTADMFPEGKRKSPEGLASSFNKTFAGKPALSAMSDGYKLGNVSGRMVKAHRAAWAMHYGRWPTMIDHINRDRSDNRICNLREVTRQQNSYNVPSTLGSSSKYVGVHLRKDRKKWVAQIKVDGRSRHIGTFGSEEEAAAAYRKTLKTILSGELSDRHGGEK